MNYKIIKLLCITTLVLVTVFSLVLFLKNDSSNQSASAKNIERLVNSSDNRVEYSHEDEPLQEVKVKDVYEIDGNWYVFTIDEEVTIVGLVSNYGRLRLVIDPFIAGDLSLDSFSIPSSVKDKIISLDPVNIEWEASYE